MLMRELGWIMRRAEGATAIEYAIVLPVLMLLTVGIVEYNIVMYASSVVEGATVTAAREAKTGYTASGMSQQAYIQSIIQNRIAGLLDPTKVQMTSKSYAEFSDIGQPEPCISPTQPPCPGTPGVNFVDVNHNGVWDTDQGAAGLGGPGDIVVYTVTYPYTISTPLLSNVLGHNGTFIITASAVVKNEPYGTGVTR